MIITIPLVIIICVVFALVFLFVKTIDRRKWLTILVSLALTPLVYFYAVYPMINIFTNFHHQKHFTMELWQETPALRYELSDDLISSEKLIGKTKEEIENLLGKAEWLSWNEKAKAHNDNKWNYSLGIEPGAFNTKKECLEVVFTDGLVTNVNPYKETITFDAKE
ncbi:MAG: hypothetical protein GYB32_06415 [Algicola sp.]|nr:hypothetical protein [Algicola sp.]